MGPPKYFPPPSTLPVASSNLVLSSHGVMRRSQRNATPHAPHQNFRSKTCTRERQSSLVQKVCIGELKTISAPRLRSIGRRTSKRLAGWTLLRRRQKGRGPVRLRFDLILVRPPSLSPLLDINTSGAHPLVFVEETALAHPVFFSFLVHSLWSPVIPALIHHSDSLHTVHRRDRSILVLRYTRNKSNSDWSNKRAGVTRRSIA